MNPRPIPRSIALVLITIAAGLAVRLVPLGLPTFVVKYAGSMLWALMIYWIVSTLFGSSRIVNVGLFAGTVAAAVEIFKLYRSPRMDAFRLTLPGILLLGRYFSVWDIVAYWIAILAGASLDRHWRRIEQ
jgi:hypothetical protein